MMKREEMGMRDIFASRIAGNLVSKADLSISEDETYSRRPVFKTKAAISFIAFLSYELADALIVERSKRDKS